MTEVGKLTNYCMKEVSPGVWRGARPDLSQIRGISKRVKTILCLEKPQVGEETAASSWRMNFISRHWSEVFPPSMEQLLFAAEYCRIAIGGLLIHCTHGVDRTGAAVFAHRVVNQGWSFEKAYQEMLDNGHHVFFYWWWQKRLRDFARRYGK